MLNIKYHNPKPKKIFLLMQSHRNVNLEKGIVTEFPDIVNEFPEIQMSGVDTLATAIKDRAHSFKYIRRATGLTLSDKQFMDLIKENGDRFQFIRIRRADTDGKPIRPGWPGVKIKGVATA